MLLLSLIKILLKPNNGLKRLLKFIFMVLICNMHDIEPFYGWRDRYVASEDKESIFHGRQYNEFSYTQKIYNYFIHPQWDDIGSQSLYLKILFVDYDEGYAILEMIGEWNDCLHNDIMTLKRGIIDSMMDRGIQKFILICENVLNYHSSEDDYYEEWYQEVSEEGGWVCLINTLDHVLKEMESARLQLYINIGERFECHNWRTRKPRYLLEQVETLIHEGQRQLYY
jgi:hypothetical protein